MEPSQRSTLLASRLVFGFAFAYWLLFCVYVDCDQIDGIEWLGTGIVAVRDRLIVWVGEHILAIPYELGTALTGSGDKTADYVGLLCIAVTALVASIAWALVDRRRRHDPQLRELLRVVIRYSLAFIILGYGTSKLFFGQFPIPSAGRLAEPYGESSPMGLLWTFMGASPAYVFFAGAGETIGALLLLWRRTTTLGALVLIAVLTNVTMMNFCYDVPVKINASHYLAMCIFLVLPDVRRLADLLVWNRPTQPVAIKLELPARWMRIARVLVKTGLILFVLHGELEEPIVKLFDPSQVWYAGSWKVTALTRNGHDAPPSGSEGPRWRYLRADVDRTRSVARWNNSDGSYGDLYTLVVDEIHHTMTMTAKDGPPVLYEVTGHDADHFDLVGTVGADQVAVKLERFDPSTTKLLGRGFRWISEAPYNR